MRVKLLFEICAVCGDEVVGDNMMTGRAWQHLAGRPEDDHDVVFGARLGEELARSVCAKPNTTEEDAARLESYRMPEPEVRAREATEEEIGTSARVGRRQILNAAKKAGFETRVNYARGPLADQWGRFSRMADSLAMAGGHSDGRGFVAMWVAKADDALAFEGAYILGHPGKRSSDELKRYLRGELTPSNL